MARPRWILGIVVALLACGGGRREIRDVPDMSIEDALSAHRDSLMARPGVVGTAIGLCDDVPCIQVFVADAGVAERETLPERLEGYAVAVKITGPMRPRGR